MGKLDLIKARLASLLDEVDVKMSTVKTDKAVLEYDGELAEGTAVYVTDAETEERVEAADGEYITEDNKVITVEGGKVISIVEKAEEPVEEPAEEPVVEEPVVAEEVTEEPVEEPAQEEEPVEEPKDEVAELKGEIEGLKGEIEGLKESIKEILDKMATISTAAPVAEEFEKTKTSKKTGNAKVDKFIERYGE